MSEVVLRIDAEPAQQARLTTVLFQDLRATGLVKVAKAREEAPADAKAGVGSDLAELIVSGVFSAGTVTAVTKIVVAYLERTKARSVTWIDGDKKVVFTGIARDDQKALAEALAAAEEDGTPES